MRKYFAPTILITIGLIAIGIGLSDTSNQILSDVSIADIINPGGSGDQNPEPNNGGTSSGNTGGSGGTSAGNIAPTENDDNACVVGINTTTTPGNPSLNQDIPESAQLGYGYMLVLTNTPADASAMAQRANQMCGAGIIPVMRACWTGNCQFEDGAEQGRFLKQIAAEATECSTVYGICGHNEPISEYIPANAGADCAGDTDLATNPEGFKRCAKRRLFLEGQWSRECVTEVDSTGRPANLKLTTSTLNGTIFNRQENLKSYSDGYGTLNSDDFSCLAINTYTVSSSSEDPDNPGVASAAYFANNIYSTPNTAFTQLPTCIMETDYFIEGSRQEAIGKNIEIFQQLMDSSNKFDLYFGLGYNWIGVEGGWEWHVLPDHGTGVLQEICGTTGSYDGTSVGGVTGGGSGTGGGGSTGGGGGGSGEGGSCPVTNLQFEQGDITHWVEGSTLTRQLKGQDFPIDKIHINCFKPDGRSLVDGAIIEIKGPGYKHTFNSNSKNNIPQITKPGTYTASCVLNGNKCDTDSFSVSKSTSEYSCKDISLNLNYGDQQDYNAVNQVTWNGNISPDQSTAACVGPDGKAANGWRVAMYQLPESTSLSLSNFDSPLFIGNDATWKGFKPVDSAVKFGSSYRFACVEVDGSNKPTGTFCEKLQINHKVEQTTCQAMDYSGPNGIPDERLTLSDLSGDKGFAANYGKECVNKRAENLTGCGLWQDSDNNGKVDLIDLSVFARGYGQPSCRNLL